MDKEQKDTKELIKIEYKVRKRIFEIKTKLPGAQERIMSIRNKIRTTEKRHSDS